MYPLTFNTSSTVSLPTSPLPLRMVVHHHLLVPDAVSDDDSSASISSSPQIDPKTTTLAQLLKTIDVYRNDGCPLKVRVEMLLGGKPVACGEVGGTASRVRDWFHKNVSSLGLHSVAELSTDDADGTSFTLYPTRSSIAPCNPSSRPAGRLVALDLKLHWGQKICKKPLKKKKTDPEGHQHQQEPVLAASSGVGMLDAAKGQVNGDAVKDEAEEYFSVFGKTLSGPNMSTGAVAVLDKAMLLLVRIQLAKKYPFVFNHAYLEKLDHQLPHLHSVVGSLSSIIAKSSKSVKHGAKASFLDVEASNHALIQYTRSSLQALAAGPKTHEAESGRPAAEEDGQDDEPDDGATSFESAVSEGLGRVYLNQIRPGYIKVDIPAKPDHPLPLPNIPLGPLAPAPDQEQQPLPPILPLDDSSDFDMFSQSSNQTVGDSDGGPASNMNDFESDPAQSVVPSDVVAAQQSLSPVVLHSASFTRASYAMPLPESDDEYDASPSPSPPTSTSVIAHDVQSTAPPPDLIPWDSDEEYAGSEDEDEENKSAVVEGADANAIESTGERSSVSIEAGMGWRDPVDGVQSSAHAVAEVEDRGKEKERVGSVGDDWAALYDL